MSKDSIVGLKAYLDKDMDKGIAPNCTNYKSAQDYRLECLRIAIQTVHDLGDFEMCQAEPDAVTGARVIQLLATLSSGFYQFIETGHIDILQLLEQTIRSEKLTCI